MVAETGVWHPTTGPLAHLRRPWVIVGLLLFAAMVLHASRNFNPVDAIVKVC